ncbi:transposase [Microvirga sp. HBU67558]|nr:transposase [Microvirga sp. HBU67558]
MAFREHDWAIGAGPAIPPQRQEVPVSCPDWIDNNRHVVERLWVRLEEWRAVATCYEKTATSFTCTPRLAALDWIKR